MTTEPDVQTPPSARPTLFGTTQTRYLAILFAAIYFSQGMWRLPSQAMMIFLKEELALSAGQVAAFFSIFGLSWLLKPVFGLLSDFVPMRGSRRRAYAFLGSAISFVSAVALAFSLSKSYWYVGLLFGMIAFGIAINDVIADALMVEEGRRHGLTGAFQSVQWGAFFAATVVVGLVGGWFAETRSLRLALLATALCPLMTFVLVYRFVREPKWQVNLSAVQASWEALRTAACDRATWTVMAVLFFFAFSPSIGTALFFHQTDALGFSQTFIGILKVVGSVTSVLGSAYYAVYLSRSSIDRLIALSIGLSVVGTLMYLGYKGRTAAIVIECLYGGTWMIAQLAFLDFAARCCPARVEGTSFALLMCVFNAGVAASEVAGGYLYETLGYNLLVIISAGTTALTWILIRLVQIPQLRHEMRSEVRLPRP